MWLLKFILFFNALEQDDAYLGSEAPLAGVSVSLHDDSFDLGHHAMITG